MKLYNYLDGIEIKENTVMRFDVEVNGVTSRSGDVENGDIFVCIKGKRQDGHAFSGVAKEKGASVLVVESVTEDIRNCGLPYIVVENTRRILPLLCARRYGNPEREMKLIGVSGTNGKTSTCKIVSEIYRAAGSRVCTFGTLEGGLTTEDPEILFKKLRNAFDSGSDTVVMEASSHALELDKLNGLRFGVGIFTNLTEEHLDFHNDMEAYAKAKSKLFENSDIGIYNFDDKYFDKIKRSNPKGSYDYSFARKNAHFSAQNCVFYGTHGFEYDFVAKDKRVKIESQLCGSFNVYNTLAAASAAFADGVDAGSISRGIASVNNIKGRLEKLELSYAPFSVYIDYAHTPDALEKVLLCVRKVKHEQGKVILVFGCGGDRDRSKRKVMGSVASKYADLTIVTSDNSRTENTTDIINEILKGIDKERPYTVIESREKAIEYAINSAKDYDIVLLAGKGHEEYEIINGAKKYFSEREIAISAVDKRFKK